MIEIDDVVVGEEAVQRRRSGYQLATANAARLLRRKDAGRRAGPSQLSGSLVKRESIAERGIAI